VHGTEEEPHGRAEPVGDNDAHHDTSDSGNGQVHPLYQVYNTFYTRILRMFSIA